MRNLLNRRNKLNRHVNNSCRGGKLKGFKEPIKLSAEQTEAQECLNGLLNVDKISTGNLKRLAFQISWKVLVYFYTYTCVCLF